MEEGQGFLVVEYYWADWKEEELFDEEVEEDEEDEVSLSSVNQAEVCQKMLEKALL